MRIKNEKTVDVSPIGSVIAALQQPVRIRVYIEGERDAAVLIESKVNAFLEGLKRKPDAPRSWGFDDHR